LQAVCFKEKGVELRHRGCEFDFFLCGVLVEEVGWKRAVGEVHVNVLVVGMEVWD
jgi:hypothetical protein